MSAQQGSAGGRGPGGRPSSGSQGGSAAGRAPSGTGPSTGGISHGGTPARQEAGGGEVRSGLSPTYTEKMSGQGSAQGDAPFGTGDSGTTGGPAASKRGCGCCGGAILAMVGVVLILSALLIL